jgi:nucleoside-diphosphate-sugar epimerase
MTNPVNLVTGATGLIGSHIAEQLIARGQRVRALVRPNSDTAFLSGLGVELIPGDLLDLASVRRAVAGADVVYHAAARVSDWGPWSQFASGIIDTTRNLLEACRAESVGRLLHVSSLAVYGHPRECNGQITEQSPLGQNPTFWDYYMLAKLRAEELVRRSMPAATIVRPSWSYGPRDRNTVPRLAQALSAGRVPIVGSGNNRVNVLYAADVADGAILAANCPQAQGQAYNLSSTDDVTQRDFLNTLTDGLGLPRIHRRLPAGLVMQGAFLMELFGRCLRRSRPPTITRKAVQLALRSTRYSFDKARKELHWQPRVPVQEGVERTLAWYFGSKVAAVRDAER